eukprot:11178766-Lingulodinium_polyedra.AAC.1
MKPTVQLLTPGRPSAEWRSTAWTTRPRGARRVRNMVGPRPWACSGPRLSGRRARWAGVLRVARSDSAIWA